MPIQFPSVTEVALVSPPIDEVICQVRFPPILRIATEEPVEFQELIRDRYPELQKRHEFQFQLAEPGNPASSSVEPQPVVFLFTNPDDKGQVALSPNFYAVSTEVYRGWDIFFKDIELVHSAVEQVYRPAYATRIGLRYINRLTTANTRTLSSEDLLGLIRPELTATLRGMVWEHASEMIGIVSFAEPPTKMNLRYGYEVIDKVPTFLLDFDYFEEGRIKLSEVLARCRHYHDAIYSGFRWSISDAALERFEEEV